ncbi:MAG TPA: UvrB/UvrC motif-containing protein [Syntrophomonas sp.]|nr:UvrB/UvrC motif-containing protein [Syntrophomonas sp.]HRW11690.1 UvrB/UvrC motif-containing protein [Syntrophomonas sp.]
MYCEECKQKPAAVHLTQVYNGKIIQSHLCEECAAKKGGFIFDPGNKFSIPNLLSSIFGASCSIDPDLTTEIKSCSGCGMTFNDIRQTGKLGCSNCYQVFAQEMEPTLRRIHGNSQHIGKIPTRSGEKVLLRKQLDALKTQLQEAVNHEEYEKAAEIRDGIKALESRLV